MHLEGQLLPALLLLQLLLAPFAAAAAQGLAAGAAVPWQHRRLLAVRSGFHIASPGGAATTLQTLVRTTLSES